jgi:hypothetical protein
MRRQPEPECSNGIRSRGVEEQLHLREGRKPPRVSKDGEEDTSHDWKVRETVTRFSGKPEDWRWPNELSDLLLGCRG